MNNQAHAVSFTRTLRLRVKRDAYSWLDAAAVEVNQVWNHCNAQFRDAARPFQDDYGTLTFPKRLSGFDLCYRTAGTTVYMDCIGADTIQRVCIEYAAKAKAAFPKQRLSWRASRGARRSLGWVPFKAASLKRKGAGIRFCGKAFRVFEAARLDGVKFRDGCFAQDAVGDWYLNVPVGIEVQHIPAPHEAVGIDLGLKTIATTSDGDTLEAGRWTQRYADKLAMAQRRGHKQRTKHIHRKISRCRQDALHKFSRKMVDRYQIIVVGNVSSTKLVKTKMAKSVLDSGWGMLKNFLDYKSASAARSFSVVDEKYTTRACSSCGALTGPAGLDMLAVRQWRCSACETEHNRDINAARNILSVGLRYKPPKGNESSPSRVAA